MTQSSARGQVPLHDIQSHVLRSMDPNRAAFLFFRVVDLEKFRRFVSTLLDGSHEAANKAPRRVWSETHQMTEGAASSAGAAGKAAAVSTKRRERDRKPVSWNIAFTWPGLKALQIDCNTLASFPVEFQQGMADRAARLGDTGDSSPECWEGWLGNRQVHGLLWINIRQDLDDEDFKKFIDHEKAAAEAYGFEVLQVECGRKLVRPDANGRWHGVEHFGFRDGISQPFADIGLGPPPPGGGTPRAQGSWDLIAPGELLLGQEDEDGLKQEWPAHELLRNNGTYLVFRKLEQDVPGFRQFVARAEGEPFSARSRLAAQMMGRWPNGTPLERSPNGPLELPDRDINDFRYADDPRGQRCPVAAHIRRTNPRDMNGRDEARRHRIWRRSISYGGDLLPDGSPGDGKSRGTLFVALNARIDQQFEFVQSRWLNGGEFVGQAGAGRCPIAGAHNGGTQDSFVGPDRPAPYTQLPRFVTMRGGDYFFVPSLPALAAIASGKETFPSPAEEGNPSLDETPDPLDPDILFALGREKLLGDKSVLPYGMIDGKPAPEPQAGPPAEEPDGSKRPGDPGYIYLVGRHEHVCAALKDDETYDVSDYDRRIRQITGNEPMIVGLPAGDRERDIQVQMFLDALKKYEPHVGRSIADVFRDVAAATMRRLLARFGPTGTLDMMVAGSGVAHALVREFYGVSGPPWLSPSAVAFKFGKLDVTQVPPDWLSTQPPIAPADQADMTLQAWLLYPFLHIFVNVVNDSMLEGIAERLTAEMFRHLDTLIEEARTRHKQSRLEPETLLAALVLLDPDKYPNPERFFLRIRLLLAGLLAATTGTISQAPALIVNQMLLHGDEIRALLRAASNGSPLPDDELDAIICETLRFEPVAPMLFRYCTEGATLAGSTIPPGSLVCLLVKTAMFDPDVFENPDAFDLTRLKGFRDSGRSDHYVHFGLAPHRCAGEHLGMAALREVLRPLVPLIELKNLRHAVGPNAQARNLVGKRDSFLVRFDPP